MALLEAESLTLTLGIVICGDNDHIFHAGTAEDAEGRLLTAGGRVLAATSAGKTLEDALKSAYRIMSSIKFEGMQYRSDIGHRALAHLNHVSEVRYENSTYANAGVDIQAGNALVKRIAGYVQSTARPGASAELGGFGGMFDLQDAGYTSAPILVVGSDGVGTKLLIAQALGKHDTIGQDLAAMNFNDLICQGAEVC